MIQLITFFYNGIQTPQNRRKKCVDCKKDYVENKPHLGEPKNFSTDEWAHIF